METMHADEVSQHCGIVANTPMIYLFNMETRYAERNSNFQKPALIHWLQWIRTRQKHPPLHSQRLFCFLNAFWNQPEWKLGVQVRNWHNL